MNTALLALSTFLASGVEAIEALTIVLATGLTRGWRSTFVGVGTATAALAVVVGALGPAVTAIPLRELRLVVGTLLLLFGIQWLRKAILRASGHKALHDEDAIFARELAGARQASPRSLRGLDAYGFTVSFKGVFLEGLEVAFIVVTFGSNQHDIPVAAGAAVAALLAVAAIGFAVRGPLARVPENAMKFAVGVMLTSFGTFWAAEGARASWPGGDASLLGVLAFVLLSSLALAALLHRYGRARLVPRVASPGGAAQPPAEQGRGTVVTRLRALGSFVWEFVAGDDPLAALGIVAGVGLTAGLADSKVSAWWLLPLLVLLALYVSIRRALPAPAAGYQP